MRRLSHVALWALIAILALITSTVTLVPALTGTTPVNIVAGSMTGTYDFGTVVYVAKAPVAVGDVITYRHGANTPVTHRVTTIQPDPSGNGVEYVTKGDANATDDAQPVYPGEVVGVVRASLPLVGLATTLLAKPHVLLFLALLAYALSRVGGQRGVGKEVRVQVATA